MRDLPVLPADILFQSLIQSSSDGIFAYDENSKYFYWSPGMEKITGEPAEYVLGKCAFDIFPFLKQVGQDEYSARALQGEAVIAPLRFFHIPRTGRSGYTETQFSPLRDQNQNIIGGMAVVRDVHARALRESQEQIYRTIAESIPHIVWVTDQLTNVVYFNQRWYDYTGLERGSSSVTLQDQLHPDDFAGLKEIADRSKASEEAIEGECRVRSLQGDYRWFLYKGVVVRGLDGQTLFRLGTATDIHDHKMAIESAKVAHERFRVLVEQTPFAFQLYSRSGDHLYANPAWESIWQVGREALAGYNILNDVHAKVGENEKLLARAFAGEVITIPAFYYDPGKMGHIGRPRWLKTYFYPIKNSQDELVQIAQVLEDVTSETNSLQRDVFLSDASKVLGSSLEIDEILSNIAELCVTQTADLCAIDLLQADGTLRRVKAAGTDSFHQTFTELMERNPPTFHAIHHPAIQALQSLKTVVIQKFSQEWHQKSKVSAEHAQAMNDVNPRSVLAVPLLARGLPLGVLTMIYTEKSERTYGEVEVNLAEEIAERTAAAIDNAKLYRESKQAVVVRDTFLSIASHELKTPITTLKLQLKLLHRWVNNETSNPDLANQMRPVVDEAQHGIRRITRLVEDMLDISKIASGKLQIVSESLDLSRLTQDICDRLRPIAQELGTTIHFDGRAPVYGEWDGMRIEQVISNLVINACRYGQKTPVNVKVWQERDHAYLSVSDQGRGIARSDQERIFQRFERAISEYEVAGFGLGLFIAQEIVTLHQGKVTLESELNQGATFTVRLPLSLENIAHGEQPNFSPGLKKMMNSAADGAGQLNAAISDEL